MRRRANGEDGMALLAVMVLMGVMLSTGLAIVSTVDTQTRTSRVERVRDSAFNLAESALNAQVFRLTADWPGLGRATAPYGTCTETSTIARCPDRASLLGGASAELNLTPAWTTTVRDNGAGSATNYYSDASTALQPGYDANNDGRVWVRAQARSYGTTRTLVELVSVEKQEEDIPHVALVAGSLSISNNGKKELLRANGGPVAVRCNPTDTPSASCLAHPLKCPTTGPCVIDPLLQNQITGVKATTGYSAAPAMTPEALSRLKYTATANGTYHFLTSTADCPPDSQISGVVVYLESSTNVTCSYGSNTKFNSAAAPGALILDHTSLVLGGTTAFYGVIYAANTVPGTPAVTTQGNAAVTGGVVIDGTATMILGSSGVNLAFDVNAFRAITSYGSAGVVQNTWREITAG